MAYSFPPKEIMEESLMLSGSPVMDTGVQLLPLLIISPDDLYAVVFDV